MSLRTSLTHLGSNIMIVAAFLMYFIAPALASITWIVLFLLKLLGYIGWSWAVVILCPILFEVIPLAFIGIGSLLMMLGASPQVNIDDKTQ
jgi:hypothetical protein